MNYIGIDPGQKGCLAVVCDEYVRVYPYDKQTYLTVLRSYSSLDRNDPAAKCVLEHVGPRKGQGVTSMFTFGQNFGWLQGALDAFRIPYELVHPQKWKRVFSVTADKNTSVEVARRLFPNTPLRHSDRCRKDDDNIAEALLMAEYARRCT